MGIISFKMFGVVSWVLIFANKYLNTNVFIIISKRDFDFYFYDERGEGEP